MVAGPGRGGGEAGAADQAGGAAGARAGGLQEGGRRLLRGDRILPRRQVETETEHKHFMRRVKGGGLWLGCGKRLLDSGMPLAARAVSLAASSGLELVIFSLKITFQTLVFFLKVTQKQCCIG